MRKKKTESACFFYMAVYISVSFSFVVIYSFCREGYIYVESL